MNGIVLFAVDVPRVAPFYEAVLGATVGEREKSHVLLLAAGGLELVIHAIPARVARSITIADPPDPRTSAVMKPAFDVDDLARVRVDAAATGGMLYPERRGLTIRGRRVLDGLDPEGNVVQFRQSPM